MEQHHRKLINKRMSELVSVTYDLKAIVDILFERVVINKWMKDYILVRHIHLIVFFYHTYYLWNANILIYTYIVVG